MKNNSYTVTLRVIAATFVFTVGALFLTTPIFAQTLDDVVKQNLGEQAAEDFIANVLNNTHETQSDDPAQPQMDSYGTVRIRALDKITARTETIELNIDETVSFGALKITANACYKSAPIEQPESAAFLQVWEFPLGSFSKDDMEEAEVRFSGWMFASSPGLSAMDHPIYDIWVLDCLGDVIPPEIVDTQNNLNALNVDTNTNTLGTVE